MLENYEINKKTLAIISQKGNTCKIMEEEEEYIVNKSSKTVLDDSCKYFGSSYQGRFEGTKALLGYNYKSPIIVEESQEIVFFPTTSPRIDQCNWIVLNKIKSYERKDNKTLITFNNDENLLLDVSYESLENQIFRATRLESVLKKRINN
jgi:competence protein ComK